MPPEPNALARLRAGQAVFGAMQSLPGAAITELAVAGRFDFIILDCQNGVGVEAAHADSLRVIAASSAFSMVRVEHRDLAAVGRYLDLGADGIMMPDVRTPADARAFVAAAAGKGSGTPVLLAMIESGEALAHMNNIAATPGLSGLVIGPHDLSANLGCPDDFSATTYRDAFVAIEAAAATHGLILGSKPHPGHSLAQLQASGHRFILVGSDILALRHGFRAQQDAARA